MTYSGRGSKRKAKGRQRLRMEQLESELEFERMANEGLKLKHEFVLDLLYKLLSAMRVANRVMREQ